MKKLLPIFLLLLCIHANATDIYFAAAGNDANTGTIASPYKTIAKLNSLTLSPGDNVYFKRGDVFTGSIVIHNSGNSSSQITIGAYGTGANPVISGFTNVTAWTNLGSNIWESSSAISTLTTCNVVRINGINTPMGRIPNSGFYTYQSFLGSTSITSSSVNSAVINWTGAQAVIRKERYVFTKPTITSASGSNLNFLSDGYNGRNGWGFFIQNDIRTLDQQNEWYFNPNTHKIDIYSTFAPTNVQVASIADLVTATNVSYITFDGITFTGANAEAFYTGNFSNCKIQNCTFDFNYQAFQGKQFGGSSANLLINNCTFNHTNNDCIDFSSEFTSPTVTNNKISNTATFEGMMASGQSGWGMNITSSNALIQNNIVDTSGYVGIGFNSTSSAPMTVKNNYVNYFCYLKDDGGGIYTGNAQVSQLIDSNIVVNGIGNNTGTGATNFLAEGIYCDDNSSGFTITHNTVAHCNLGYFLHNANNITLTNNTGYNNGMGLFISNDNGATFTTNIYSHQNKFIAATATGTLGIGDERTIYYATAHTSGCDICNFGSSDSNYYARPIDDNLTIRYTIYAVADNDANLAMWQTYSGLDAHSHKSPATITNVNQLFFAYNPNSYDSTVSIPAGTWIDVTGTPFVTSIVLHAYSSIVLISTGSLITPTISWSPLTPITYGTALGVSELNATSGGVTGTFAYNPGSGTILNAGVQNLSTVFTPQDQTTYSTASKTVPITVNQATATLSANNTTQTYIGFPLQPTITTSPAGLTVVNTTYNGVGQMPTNAGSYSCISGLTNTNYSASPISYTFIINKSSVTITVSNTTQTYTGSPLPVTVTTNPNVSGISVTYNGSATVPTNAGSYTVVASLTNSNYSATPVTTTLVINKATPTVSWSTPTAITYGTALSGTQLNATASVAGTFTYTPASGAILNAGTNVLSVNFAPTDGTDYNNVNNTTVSLVVNKATATISLSNLNQTFDGSPKPVTVTTSPIGLTVITTTYNGSTSAPSAVGSYPVISSLNNSNYTATPATGNLVISTSAANIFITNYANLVYSGSQQTPTVTCAYSYTITYNGSSTAPTNVGSYTTIATINDGIHTGADTVTMTIIKATPVIVWANPSAITYGTSLSGTQLNASSTVAGTFTYTPISGTLLNAGTYVLSTSFTPTDASNYNTATETVNLIVNKSSATLSLSNLNQVYDGTAKPVTVTSSPIGLSGITVLYNGSSSIPTNAGSYPITVNLSNANYSASNVTGTLVVAKASSILSWAIPSAVQQGTSLSATQLNATSTGAGTFIYNPTFGYVVQNNITLIATFTPTDTINYNTQTISVFLSVYGNPLLNYYIRHGKIKYLNLPNQ